jgi:small GTP-binding protein
MSHDMDGVLKIVVIGDTQTGKSSLVSLLTVGTIDKELQPTIGVFYATKQIVCDKEEVRIEIWDTAGQARFRNLTGMYYRGAQGIAIVYDPYNRDSYDNVTKIWEQDIKSYCGEELPLSIILIANMTVKPRKELEVSDKEAQDLAQSKGWLFSKTEENQLSASEAFIKLAGNILERQKLPCTTSVASVASTGYQQQIKMFNDAHTDALKVISHFISQDSIAEGLSSIVLINDKDAGKPPVFKLIFGGDHKNAAADHFRTEVSKDWRFSFSRFTAPKGYGKDDYAILSLSALTKVVNGIDKLGRAVALNELAGAHFKTDFAELKIVSQAEAQPKATIAVKMPRQRG